jgi:hypothetical protein
MKDNQTFIISYTKKNGEQEMRNLLTANVVNGFLNLVKNFLPILM